MYLTKTKTGRKVFSLVAVAVFSLAFTPIGSKTAIAAPSVQVVFSGTGTTVNGLSVGFWIWCMPEGNSPLYTGACRGSVLVNGQEPASGVAGFIVQNPDGTYVARVFSVNPNTFFIAAAFRNVNPEPALGPNNLVAFGILTTDGTTTGLAPNSVVVVTGPGN